MSRHGATLLFALHSCIEKSESYSSASSTVDDVGKRRGGDSGLELMLIGMVRFGSMFSLNRR